MSFSDIISTLLFLSFALLAFRAVRYGLCLLHGYNRRQMFAPLFGALCDGVGDTGLSVICLDAEDVDTVADLLTVEYERYEAVVVVDSARSPELLEALTDIYALVNVDYRRSEDFAPSVGVRGLYRSRRRRFRRLTVVDTVSISPETDADAAADIALYDYITVINGDITLLPCAVERLVAEICSSPEPPHELRTQAGTEIAVYLRDDVAEGGGFASGERHFCRRGCRRRIYETLAVSHLRSRSAGLVVAGIAVVTAFVALFAFSTRDNMPLSALLATAAVVLSSIIFSVPFVAPHLKGSSAFVYTVRNFCEKLLLKISQ